MGRLYELKYPNTDRPVYIEDAGHLLKISGILLQGQGENILLMSPTANQLIVPNDICLADPTLEEWCAILKQTDDPVFFKDNEHWNPKAIVRKQQYAISGAIQQKVWARDGFQCLYCGAKMGDVQMTVDHFIPLEMGGDNDLSNYISACKRCNKKKGAIGPTTFCKQEVLDYDGLWQYLHGKSSLSFIGHLR